MQVRYTARSCENQEKIHHFLRTQRVGIIGVHDTPYPYAVPVNYVWHNGKIYFHGAGAGKKLSLLERDPHVIFTVYQEDRTVEDVSPCHCDTAYFSVMIFGRAERMTDAQEGAEALGAIVKKFMPGKFREDIITPGLVEKYRSGVDGNATGIVRITPVEITAKENIG